MNKSERVAARMAMLAAALIPGSPAVGIALAGNAMPIAQQNALVHQYCAVCHTDAARNGGLTLEHFDAAEVSPSLAAMMLSKLTGGVSLNTAKAASSDPGARALVATKMRSGAMGAAGIPIPDKATIDALIAALASEATDAVKWSVKRTEDPATKSAVIEASILRELPSATGEAVMYRLVLDCNPVTQAGRMQLGWAPLPRSGTISVTLDRERPLLYNVEGTETMGNGSRATTGHAAVSLYGAGEDSARKAMPLPQGALVITEFSGESVEFPFHDLTESTRQSLSACFRQ